MDVFKKFYSELTEVFPTIIKNLVTKLYSDKLLSDDHKNNIAALTGEKEKTEYFLDKVIKPSLKIGYTELFDEMLKLMKASDDRTVMYLVKKISDFKAAAVKGTKRTHPVEEAPGPSSPAKRSRLDIREKPFNGSPREELIIDSKIEDFADIDKLKDENVVGAFTYLFRKLVILFSKIDFAEFKSVCMLRGAPLPQGYKQRIRDAQELDDIFDVLENPLYCNWLNVRLLERIAKNIENQLAEELIKIYKENVYSRKISNVKKYFKICFNKETVSYIEVKINKTHKDLTVEEILNNCEELEEVMDIYTGAVSVTDSSAGCLRIIIVIPLYCSLYAFKTVQRNALKLRQFHIQYLEIESLPKVFALNYSDNENTLVSLSSTIPIFLDASQVVNHYYTYLEGHMDADSVSHMMHYKHLITDDDYKAITAAPNDHKMNTVILQYVRAMNANELIYFCNVLKNIEIQKIIGNCLSTALETVRNSSIDSKDQTTGDEDLSRIHLMFLDLVDKLILMLSTLLSTAEKLPFDLFQLFHGLNAGDSIPLFTAKSLQRFSNCKSAFCFKISLLPFITWLDHSILNELVTASGSDTAKQLLHQFDHKINKNESVTSYPIPTPNQLMIPLDDSEYTILAMKSYNCHNDITLYQVEEIKSLMTSSLKVSNHVFQLLAIHSKANYLYWMIPKCVVSFIRCNLKSNHELLQNALSVSILPDGLFAGESIQEKLKGPFSLLYSQAHEYDIEHDDAQEYYKSLQETVGHLKADKVKLVEQIQELESRLQVQLGFKKDTEKLKEKSGQLRIKCDKLQLELKASKIKIDELNKDNKQLIQQSFELQKIKGKEEREKEASKNKIADELKVMQNRTKRVDELRSYFVKKFTSESFDDAHDGKICVAFKLSDGKNIHFNFSPTSNIKEMYQYFFTKEDQYPFTLFTMKPRQELPLSKGSSLITDYPVKDALIIMEWSDENLDNFLNMLDEGTQDNKFLVKEAETSTENYNLMDEHTISFDPQGNDDKLAQLANFFDIKFGMDFSRELQVLMVGAENTGKTCLIASFLGEKFIEQQEATEEIDTEVCKIYCKNWSKMSLSDMKEHLHKQFTRQLKKSALKVMSDQKLDYVVSRGSEKGSLAKVNLADNIPQPHPIDVHEAASYTFTNDSDSLYAVVWDFAGQVIFHNTHSLFISESGVPVITFNASMQLTGRIVVRDGATPPAECCTNIESIHYWLQVVDSMCSVKGSDDDLSPLLPTALLVGTHIDLLHPDIKEARKIAKRIILPVLEKELLGKPYARHLAGITNGIEASLEKFCFFISNKCRDEEIDRLKDVTISVASCLRKKQPIFFLKIEYSLLELENQVISKSMLADIVGKCSFPMSEDSPEFKSLLHYFHSKRTILYFSEIESLKDLIILSPRWLAKLLSYMITAHSYVTGTEQDSAWMELMEYGILHENLLVHMLEKFQCDYPTAVRITKQQVIDILLCFHLVALINRKAWFAETGYPYIPQSGDTFIVPSLVPRDETKVIPCTEKERIVYFKFDTGFIPTSVLNQLIADCICYNVKKENQLLWMRHGKIGLQLGLHQKYYISRCQEKQSIQLTITVSGNDAKCVKERAKLIDDVTKLLADIMEVFMPAAKRPVLFVPCPLCHILHITLKQVYEGYAVICPLSGDDSVLHSYYSDLLPSSSTVSDTDVSSVKLSHEQERHKQAHSATDLLPSTKRRCLVM